MAQTVLTYDEDCWTCAEECRCVREVKITGQWGVHELVKGILLRSRRLTGKLRPLFFCRWGVEKSEVGKNLFKKNEIEMKRRDELNKKINVLKVDKSFGKNEILSLVHTFGVLGEKWEWWN